MRIANVEGPFGHKLAPPFAVLRVNIPFGKAKRRVVCVLLTIFFEVALEQSSVGQLSTAGNLIF